MANITMSKIKVLIVDDEKSFREPLAKRLEQMGFDVSSCDKVSTVLNVDKSAFLYDVVLLDATMSDNSGNEYLPEDLVKHLKNQYPNVEVILCTGWGIDISSGLNALNAGAYRFMAKPLETRELELAIRAAVEHRNLRQRAQSYEREKLTTILFLAANPLDSTRLRLDEEIRAIDYALLQSRFGGLFDVRQHWAVRVTDLQNYLLRHNPRIIHFSGHGSNTSEIILEDSTGNSSPVPSRALSNLFSALQGNIKCVILNACYSEKQALSIAESVDCVVGMSKAIGDKAAISFAAAFYQALGYGKNIKTAFELGCAQIDLESLGEQDTPKLLAKNKNPEEIFIFPQESRNL